jgi:hypothetical protein
MIFLTAPVAFAHPHRRATSMRAAEDLPHLGLAPSPKRDNATEGIELMKRALLLLAFVSMSAIGCQTHSQLAKQDCGDCGPSGHGQYAADCGTQDCGPVANGCGPAVGCGLRGGGLLAGGCGPNGCGPMAGCGPNGCGPAGCGLNGCGVRNSADYVPSIPHNWHRQTQPAGPPTGTYAYPYYTVRAPRDFFMDAPSTIGY